MRLYRAFATVGGMTILSRVLGFLRDVLIAGLLGSGAAADAFFVAFRLPNLFRRLLAEGAFDASFVPLFAKRLHGEGEAAATDFAASACAGLTALLILLTLLGEIAMPWLMLGLAPGFAADPAKFAFAVLLARIALPYLVFMSVVALYAGMLNSLGRFALSAFVPSLLNIVLIAILLAVIALGFKADRDAIAIALCWGIALSGLIQLGAIVIAAARHGIRLRPVLPVWNGDMRRLLSLALPGLLAGGIAQLTLVLGTIVASLQDRAVSWLYYADRIFQLPLGAIGVGIGVVLLPELSRRLRDGDAAARIESENRAMEFALLLTLPAAVALILASRPIVEVLFQRGAFTATDARATADMLAALAFGLPAFVLVKLLNPAFFAREDTRTPMLCAGHALAVNAVLAVPLFLLLGVTGIAVAIAAAGWANALLLAARLHGQGGLTFDAAFRARLPRIVLATLVMAAGLYLAGNLLEPWFHPANGLLAQACALLLLVGGGLALYLGAAELLGAMTVRPALRRMLQQRRAG